MSDQEPTPEQLQRDHFHILMMGYLDGELDSEQTAEFRAWLAREPQAGRDLAQYEQLNDLARQVRLKEPQDYEWDRFWQSLYSRMERRTGWILCMTGLIVAASAALVWLVRLDQIPLWLRIGLATVGAGGVILFASVLRGRMRTLPFDRYRKVRR